MGERRCRFCERIFLPSKYQPGQSVCRNPGCQRRRRADYHRQKIAADPEYRQVCLDSPQKWRPATRTIGDSIANSIQRSSSGTASSSTFGTRNAVCAILQTTTQFST
jgi:hypothetical protein